MSGKRTERVAHQLREEISGYIHKGLLKDPRIGFVTISGVRVSDDLRHAKVFFSVFGETDEASETQKALQRAQSFIRRQLGKDLHIRRVPELDFVLDSSIEKGIHIAKLLQELPEFREEANHTEGSGEWEGEGEGELYEDDEYGEDHEEDSELFAGSAGRRELGESEQERSSSSDLREAVPKTSSKASENGNHPVDWRPLVAAIHAGKRFLVAAHRDPDGDAIGSTTALYGLLKKLGKEVVLFSDAPYPPQFLFLPFAKEMQTSLEGEAPFDVSILCDCGEVERAPKGFPTSPAQRGTFLVIDHHLTSRLEGDICFNDPSAPAVGLLIYDLCKRLHVDIDLSIAKGVYCALVSDTGGFRYQKTDPYTFRAAAELLEVGVSPWEIASAIFESAPIERQRLLARTLDTLEIHAQGHLACLTITQEMIQSIGATSDMTDGFINFGRGIQGVEVAVLFREEATGWKVSFRSRGRVNVAAIASPLGGGGHHNAAGAVVSGPIEPVKTLILQQVEQLLPMLLQPA